VVETLGNPWWAYVVLGVCAGLLSGTLGIGSGTVLIPALVFVLLFPQKVAQGTGLAVMVPMVLVGAIRYKLNPELDISLLCVGIIALGAVVGALMGAELAQHLPADLLRKVFAIFIVVVGIKMLWTSPNSGKLSSASDPATVQVGPLDNNRRQADDGT